MAASSYRLGTDDPDTDMVAGESQPGQWGLEPHPQEPGVGFEPPAEYIETHEAKGNDDPAVSQEPEVSRTKYRELDPKSQKDLYERTLIPNALSSTSGAQAMFQKCKSKWSQLKPDSHGVQREKTYDVLTQKEIKMKFVA